MTDASAWVVALPKIELHIHLEGTMRPATVPELSIARLGWTGKLTPGWEHTYYTYTDFEGFMAQLTPRFPGTPAEYERLARECFEDLAAQNVVYAEVSVDGRVRKAGDADNFWPYMKALARARAEAEATLPFRVQYIIGLMRTLPMESAVYRTQLAAEARDHGMGVVGIDIHGDEEKESTAAFEPAYRLAAELGLGLRAHAGEARGPESVWEAIDTLHVRRIGHGIRALQDPTLVKRLQRGDVTLEICPTSNVRTGIVPDLASHPIRLMYDLGIPVTVNSDDPLPFFTNVERECRLLVDLLGFTREDLRRLMINAANAAFLPANHRRALIDVIDSAYEVDNPPCHQ